jgi:excinuclease ABC subunit C
MDSPENETPAVAGEERSRTIQEKIRNVPPLPGVYLMKGKKGGMLYIGKALSLKDRVRSYFQKGVHPDPRIVSMVRQAADIEWIVTGSELEALILENTLVKKHKPRYNIVLRDDKNYPFLRLSADPFPQITVVRRIKKDGALYFGPYVPVHAMRDTLKMIRRTFPLATCKLDLTKRYDRACVEYEILRCVGPCIGAVDQQEYGKVVREVRLFLEGKDRELLHALEEKMDTAARELRFEEAARIRDRVRNVKKVLERQRMVSVESRDVDVIALAREGEIGNLQVLFFRGGMLIGRKDIPYERLKGTPDEEVYLSFIEQFYSRDVLIPEEILLPLEPPEQDLLQKWLTGRRGGRVELTVPQRGRKRDLVKLAFDNASQSL